ncbi:MAG: hypothetical protein ABIG20_01640 [archaeon]
MSIRIIAEGVYDTAHAVFEAHQIRKEKPDAVFLELPDDLFQRILTDYSSGKIGIPDLKKRLFKAIQKEERRVDHNLVDKFLEGEIEHEELEVIETEGREIHVMKAAKDVGAELIAMDMPLEEVERYIEKEFRAEHINKTRHVIISKELPDILWKLSDIFHYPYYFIERIMHHHAIHTTNPYKHNVSTCRVCKMGTRWDRFVNRFMIPIFEKMPLSKGLKDELKIAYIIRRVDYYRERHMARKILQEYRKLTLKLGRTPKIIAIVHLWNAMELERLIQGVE